MFEKYTEKARRVIFFARYEASAFGADAINAEHILLGLLREHRFLSNEEASQIRQEIEHRAAVGKKVATSVEMSLSDQAKRALEYAVEESDLQGSNYVGVEHILLGLLRVEKSLAAELLHQKGLRLEQMRKNLGATVHASGTGSEITTDFTLQHIDHVALSVRDLDASAVWYQEVLGLQRRYQEAWKIPVMLCAGMTCVALFPAAAARRRQNREAVGMRHLAFRVDRHNFKRAEEVLQRRGIDFKIEDHRIAHSIYLHDPDGNEIELTTYEV